MRPEELLDIIRRRPFQPCRITMTGGETYELRHPDMALVGRSVVAFGTPGPEDNSLIAEHLFWVSLLHIVKIEPLLQSKSKSENGKRKGK